MMQRFFMFLALAAASLAPLSTATANETTTGQSTATVDKFEQDRAAILGMAGKFKVTFDFREVMALRPDYELKKPYRSEAYEMVKVVTDEPKHISMQHLLVVVDGEGEKHVVKHWRQDWRYEQAETWTYKGDDRWEPVTQSPTEIEGTWTQIVYQVDDSPRYWGTGTWVHEHGVSRWTSDLTNRPLPRREHTKRDDYDILQAINTHIVTDNGWLHRQENRKLDTSNSEHPIIALETGLNPYIRTDKDVFTPAEEYWSKTADFWAAVREAWTAIYAQREPIHIRDSLERGSLRQYTYELEDEYWEEPVDEVAGRMKQVIEAFLIQKADAS
ncbi:MAG: hypothetical protein MI741_05930 [Rhodospirillales bacterium]|nr:hypothetical protein [Rhodospirillales bacterium]